MSELERHEDGDQYEGNFEGTFLIDNRYIFDHLQILCSPRETGEFSEYQLHVWFLNQTLGFSYDGRCEGMNEETGHLLYRLTDHIDLEVRSGIEIWPRGADEPWITVEDWRGVWENHHPEVIPAFAEEISPTHVG